MESLTLQEEIIIKDIRNFCRLKKLHEKKRTKLHCY